MDFIKIFIANVKTDMHTIASKRDGSLNNLDRFFIFVLVLVGALLYLNGLDFLMFDPWENHYSQVTWETLEHGSFARLWYRNQNKFWSKPPLLFWIMMPFFKIHISEFMGRLPVVIFSLCGLSAFYFMLTRLMNRKASFLAALVLMMSPMYYQVSRQIMVDLPFIVLNTIAILAMCIYFFADFSDDDSIRIGFKKFGFTIKRRDFFLYLFYFLEGWAFLAKGLLSIVLPGVTLLLYMIITGNFGAFFSWQHLKKHLIGMLVYLGVIFPWLGYMWYDAGFEFIKIFIWFHHFKRVAGVIHKPNDLYTLYPRIIGYATFPWAAFIPAAIYRFFQGDRKLFAYKQHIFLFSAFIGPFFFLSYSSTKFYHYIAPTIPFIAVFIGFYLHGLFNSDFNRSRKVEIIIALFIVGAIGRDIGNKYGILAHIVTFYHERRLPRISSFLPMIATMFSVFSISLLLAMFSKSIRKIMPYVLFTTTAVFMLFYFIVAMPKISTRYCLKPLIDKYLEDSPERAPIADYYKWFRRSTSFWLKNEATFLKNDKEKKVMRFFNMPGTQYAILKRYDRKRFNNLMRRINKSTKVIKKGPLNYLMRVSGAGTRKDFKNKDKHLVKKLPDGAKKVGAIFDNAAELIGYKIVSGSEKPKEGETVHIDIYFKALRNQIPKDYTVFLHNEGDMGDKRTKGDEAMAQGNYPTTFWKKGEIIRHRLKVYIPRNNKNTYYSVYTGIYQEDYRANLTNYEDVPNDGDNRLELVRLYVQR